MAWITLSPWTSGRRQRQSEGPIVQTDRLGATEDERLGTFIPSGVSEGCIHEWKTKEKALKTTNIAPTSLPISISLANRGLFRR